MDRSIFLQLLPLSVENFKAEFGDNVIVNLSAYALNCCRELPNPCYVVIKNCSAYNDWNITTGARDGWGPGDGFQTWLSEKNSPSLYTAQCSPTIPGAVTVLSLKMHALFSTGKVFFVTKCRRSHHQSQGLDNSDNSHLHLLLLSEDGIGKAYS